jgi:hypothetical protein
MSFRNEKAIKNLCEEHWNYIEKLLLVHGESPKELEKIKYHYITAMEHGYKHAMEDFGEC